MTKNTAMKLALAAVMAGGPAWAQTHAESQASTKTSNAGVRLADEGKYAEAIVLYDEALRINPRNQTALFNRASSSYRIGRYEPALKDIERAIDYDPMKGDYLLVRAWILEALSRPEEARADYKSLLALEPDNSVWLSNWGDFLGGTGSWSEGLAVMSRAYSTRSSSPATRRDLAKIYARLMVAPSPGVLAGPAGTIAPQAGEDDLAPREGEVRLDGVVAQVDAAKGRVTFDALSFTVPGGRFKALSAPKRKVATLGSAGLTLPLLGKIPASALRAGDVIVVTGRDGAQGVAARAARMGARSPREAKERGQLLAPPKSAQSFPAPPDVAGAALGSPQFTLDDGEVVRAGTAFVARDGEGPRVLVAALHLLGPAGGAKAQLRAEDVGTRVKQVGGVGSLVAKRALSSKGVPLGDAEGDFSGDVVAFALDDAPDSQPALSLATEDAKVGQPVWVARPGGAAATLLPARVLLSDAKRLVVQGEPAFAAQGLSGAPIVDAKGHVVGMLLGSLGNATLAAPTSALRAHTQPTTP